MPDADHWAERVRVHDNDRFLATLFAPEDARPDLLALYAFNLELAKIRETVSEPLIGRMRLQFWRDAVPGIAAGTPPAHEVAAPLAAAVRRRGIAAADLAALIDARETDLDDIPPADLAALERYAEGTSSALMALALRILGVDPADHDKAVRDAGIAVALVGLVRSVPYQASTGRVTLPADLCAAAGLDPAEPGQWPATPDVSAITGPMLARAAERLGSARLAARGVPRRGRAALLPLSLAALYLRRLRALGGDPARLAARPPGVSRHLTLLRAALTGRP